jgi:putative ABC transport system permease protein
MIGACDESPAAGGIPPLTASIRAATRFSSLNACKAAKLTRMISTTVREVRFALRQMRRQPGFSLALIVTLGLGIGVSTAVFSLVYGVLLRPFPYRDADRLVVLQTLMAGTTGNMRGGSVYDLEDWRRAARTLEAIGAHITFPNTLDLDGQAHPVTLTFVSWHLFPVLGVSPALGRTFTEDEDVYGGDVKKTILSHRLWKRVYRSDPAIIGRTITARGDRYTVIGVMPEGFGFPENSDLWTPLMARYSGYRDNGFWQARDGRLHSVVARLKDGSTMEQAAAEMNAVAQELGRRYPDTNAGVQIVVTPLREAETGKIRPYLILMFSAVILVLLIGCVNSANLLLARAAAREKEIAIRTALGSGVWPVVRQLLTESMVIALVAGCLGLLLATLLVQLFPLLVPVDLPFWMRVDVNAAVAIFCLILSLATGLVFGVSPALRTAKADVNSVLKQGTRGLSGASGSAKRLRNALVVGEVALSIVLLVAAGLMVRSFLRLQKTELGVRTTGLVTAYMARFAPNTTREQQLQLYSGSFRRALRKLEQIPGVVSAGAATDVPYSLWLRRQADRDAAEVVIRGQNENEARFNAPVQSNYVTSGFFPTMGIRFVEGRNFAESDDLSKPSCAIVNRRMAEALWPGRPAVGQQIRFAGGSDWTTVIGVVENIRYLPTERKPGWELYWHYGQIPTPQMQAVLAVRGDPADYIERIRAAIREAEPQIAIVRIKPIGTLMTESLWQSRLWGCLFACFAALALMLAAFGLYAVMSYIVGTRTREIGIRVALGAKPGQVVGMMTRYGMSLVAMGAVSGIGAALVLSRVLRSVLAEAGDVEPAVYAVVLVVLAAASLAACAVPAIRAARVDPVVALRSE